MIKQTLIAATVSLFATSSFAQSVCTMNGAVPVPKFEEAKAAFLASDYVSFENIAGELLGERKSILTGPLNQLDRALPDDYDGCETIVQRRDAGGMVQEVTNFTYPGQDFTVAIYLMGMPVRGEMKVGLVVFHSELEEVLNYLK